MPLTYSFPGPTGLATTTDGRKDFAGMIYRDTTGAPRPGIFPRTPAPLVTSRTDMGVNVAAFEGVAVQFGGAILLANDGTAQVPLAAAPASNSRIDVVYAKQNESAAPATDADNQRVLGVATGLSASNPIAPTLPPGAIPLASVLVPAGVAATNASGVVITATHQFTTMTGGLLWVRNAVELAALTNVPMGQHALQLSDNTEWMYGPTGFTPTATVVLDTGWIDAPLTAGWQSYTTATYGTVAYRRIGNNVFVRGVLYKAATGSTTVFVLPAGFRPAFSMQTAGISIDNAGNFTSGAANGTTVSMGQIHFIGDL